MPTKKEVNKDVPITFQVMDTIQGEEDSRFLPVKIWLMHTGQNYNGSFFSKEVVSKAIPSLANTPILAYLEENSWGEKDFSDHRTEIYVEDGEYKERYIGQAIGIIPETNNAEFEFRVGDDGIEREYLTVEGLMWTKWNDPVEIIREFNTTGQSMELHNDYSGDFDENGVFHFTDFKFFGACALGKDVMPAMENATIELDFSQDKFAEEVKIKLSEYFEITKKEEYQVSEEMKAALDAIKALEEAETVTTEDKAKAQEKVDAIEDADEKAEAKKRLDAVKVTEEKEEPETDMSTEEGAKTPQKDSGATETGSKASVDTKVVEEFEALKEAHETLKHEVKELRDFKRAREVEDLKAKFEGKIDKENLEAVFESMGEASLEDIEKEVFATIGRLNFEKATASAPKKDNTIKVPVAKKEKTVTDAYDGYFNRQ